MRCRGYFFCPEIFCPEISRRPTDKREVIRELKNFSLLWFSFSRQNISGQKKRDGIKHEKLSLHFSDETSFLYVRLKYLCPFLIAPAQHVQAIVGVDDIEFVGVRVDKCSISSTNPFGFKHSFIFLNLPVCD